MKITMIDLPDNFEKGMCYDCPFSYIDEYDVATVVCVFHCRYDECPLEICENRCDIDKSMVLVDMAMPKSCHECCCYDVDYQRCVIASQGIPSRYHYDGSIRPEWCPIKEDVLWKLK